MGPGYWTSMHPNVRCFSIKHQNVRRSRGSPEAAGAGATTAGDRAIGAGAGAVSEAPGQLLGRL